MVSGAPKAAIPAMPGISPARPHVPFLGLQHGRNVARDPHRAGMGTDSVGGRQGRGMLPTHSPCPHWVSTGAGLAKVLLFSLFFPRFGRQGGKRFGGHEGVAGWAGEGCFVPPEQREPPGTSDEGSLASLPAGSTPGSQD